MVLHCFVHTSRLKDFQMKKHVRYRYNDTICGHSPSGLSFWAEVIFDGFQFKIGSYDMIITLEFQCETSI